MKRSFRLVYRCIMKFLSEMRRDTRSRVHSIFGLQARHLGLLEGAINRSRYPHANPCSRKRYTSIVLGTRKRHIEELLLATRPWFTGTHRGLSKIVRNIYLYVFTRKMSGANWKNTLVNHSRGQARKISG